MEEEKEKEEVEVEGEEEDEDPYIDISAKAQHNVEELCLTVHY